MSKLSQFNYNLIFTLFTNEKLSSTENLKVNKYSTISLSKLCVYLRFSQLVVQLLEAFTLIKRQVIHISHQTHSDQPGSLPIQKDMQIKMKIKERGVTKRKN